MNGVPITAEAGDDNGSGNRVTPDFPKQTSKTEIGQVGFIDSWGLTVTLREYLEGLGEEHLRALI